MAPKASRRASGAVLRCCAKLLEDALGKEHVDRTLQGHAVVDAIYYPGNMVLTPAETLMDVPTSIAGRVTRHDVMTMAADDMIMSADDENPHGIMNADFSALLKRPSESGLMLTRYEDAATGNHHVVWLASPKDTADIVSGQKRCVSVAFSTAVEARKGSPTYDVHRVIDHVALLDPVKNPPFFKDCQVVGMLPLAASDKTLSARLARAEAYALGIISRATHASLPRGASADAAPASGAAAVSCPATPPHNTTMAQPAATDAAPPAKYNHQSMMEMIASNDPAQIAKVRSFIERTLKDVGISTTASVSEVSNAVSASVEDQKEAISASQSLVSLISLYRETEPAATSAEPTPMDISPPAASPPPATAEAASVPAAAPSTDPYYRALADSVNQMAQNQHAQNQALMKVAEEHMGVKIDTSALANMSGAPDENLRAANALGQMLTAYNDLLGRREAARADPLENGFAALRKKKAPETNATPFKAATPAQGKSLPRLSRDALDDLLNATF